MNLTRSEAVELQKLIDQTVETQRPYYKAQAALMEWCQNRYGYEPGDIDADNIIDALGGCGVANGMTAELFHRDMTEYHR